MVMFIIKLFFNMLYKTNLNDVLCCLKIMKKKHLNHLNIKSKSFNIEVEIMSKLVLKNLK